MGLKEEDHSKMKERKRLILLKSFIEAMEAIWYQSQKSKLWDETHRSLEKWLWYHNKIA